VSVPRFNADLPRMVFKRDYVPRVKNNNKIITTILTRLNYSSISQSPQINITRNVGNPLNTRFEF